MNVSKLLEKAREATEHRNYDYAIELYLQACKLSPDDATARRELRAVENRMAKEKGTSLWAKTKIAGGNRKALIEALRELAYAYEAVGKNKEAMDTWQLVKRFEEIQ